VSRLRLAVDMARVEAFLTLAKELHFCQAADRLRISQPLVSCLIASLARSPDRSLNHRRAMKAGFAGAAARQAKVPKFHHTGARALARQSGLAGSR
jgi:hypothetical protein